MERDLAAPGLGSARQEEIRENQLFPRRISFPGIFSPGLQPCILVSLPCKQLFLSQPTVLARQGRCFVLPDSPSMGTPGLIPDLTLPGAGGCIRSTPHGPVPPASPCDALGGQRDKKYLVMGAGESAGSDPSEN